MDAAERMALGIYFLGVSRMSTSKADKPVGKLAVSHASQPSLGTHSPDGRISCWWHGIFRLCMSLCVPPDADRPLYEITSRLATDHLPHQDSTLLLVFAIQISPPSSVVVRQAIFRITVRRLY